VKAILDIPIGYEAALPEDLAKICNGMGAACWPKWVRKVGDSPAFCWGISLRPAADIHDWDYYVGEDEEARVAADKRFGENCRRLVFAYTRWWEWLLVPWIVYLRLLRTKAVYLAVRWGGRTAFWAAKGTVERGEG